MCVTLDYVNLYPPDIFLQCAGIVM